MARNAVATVHLSAIRHNYRLAKAQAPGAKAAAIIKANAYGHGAIPVARALAADVDAFGVACIEEALELRAAGISQPILLLEGFFHADELPLIDQHQLWTALHTDEQLTALCAYAPQLRHPLNVWIKLDSGMHRLGFAPDRAAELQATVSALPQVAEVVLMTHFARSDEPEEAQTVEQITRFNTALEGVDVPVSLSNSAGVMAWPAAHGQWLRPGMMLYGATPFMSANAVADQLQAGMTLTSEIIAVRDVPAGEAVGYGATFTCDTPRRIGTVAMGYGDGYPRHAKNGTPVLVNGQRTALAGRVSMDMLTIDLTHLPEAKVGDTVTLWGPALPAAEVAPWCDTIPYTLVTCLTPRVKRVYQE
ncbi:alanine racemase [Salinispirillum sp. LH 10-3-1]|uniref:Alanine racemase n=1 Tax=Salinispirillum sp. LH 10-3-1 TaxID=2952525 RepID=A0AB38YEI5_9GAMM